MLLSLTALLAAVGFASRVVGLAEDVPNASTKKAITPEVEKLVRDLMGASGIPGLSLGVVRPDGEVEFGSWGIGSEEGDSVTSETSFGIASCSKAFLASAMGILIDDFSQGKNVTALPAGIPQLDWYTDVKTLLPDDWELMDEWASEKATLRDILSHQSGLPRHEFAWRPTDSPIDVARRMRHLRPAFELRERYHYSNQMYIVASQIISTYAGMPYTDFVKQRIWDPLNMTSSTFNDTAASQLTQSRTSTGRRTPFWFPSGNLVLGAGPAGVITNMIDMMKWTKTLLNDGVEPESNRTVIPLSAFEEITTAQIVMEGKASQPGFSISGYGMGWMRMSYQGHEIITHLGAIPGFSSEIFLLPAQKLGIVALANADLKQPAELAVIYRIIEDTLGLEHAVSQSTADSILHPAAASSSPPITSTPPLPLPLERYAGQYVDAGYGNLTLCAPSETPTGECVDILGAYAPFDDVSDTSSNTLYARIHSVWISHIRLRHSQDNKFVMSGTYLFSRGFGKDESPFETSETPETSADIEFVVQGGEDGENVIGFAVTGLVGEVTDAQRRGGSVRDAAARARAVYQAWTLWGAERLGCCSSSITLPASRACKALRDKRLLGSSKCSHPTCLQVASC